MTEAVSILIINRSPTVLDIVMNFMALTVLKDLSQYIMIPNIVPKWALLLELKVPINKFKSKKYIIN